MDQVEKMY